LELLLECILKVVLEGVIKVLVDRPHVVRFAIVAVRRIAILLFLALGGV
jgi:hypothetical protein